MHDSHNQREGLPHSLCLYDLLRERARKNPDRIAVTAAQRRPIGYQRLLEQVEKTVSALRSMGIGPTDRVAIVLPNGPEMATAFLGVAAGAICAPLNPAYREKEFEFCVSDLRAKALIVEAETESPVVPVAQARGIPVLELTRGTEEAGVFALSSTLPIQSCEVSYSPPEGVALVLHTSGTTSRPKTVPLTHANLCHAAHNIKSTLKLTADDRCLNVMPLFHIHGLVGAVLSSIAAGSTVIYTPGFCAPSFFEWMEEYRPTWYTAVPTMHQAILARAVEKREAPADPRLRLIRSSSAALPPQVLEQLEQVFQTPVIESYGMTEAAHQMASNPLPPSERKPGSVGLAAGPEIAIMNEGGELLPQGRKGEIVIHGPSVMRAYENNPDANRAAFTSGWFRTGDQGWLDSEGYLFITGRLKEIINRGGEKISPREVDEVLLAHPSVAQAVAFAIPDPKLGEDVGAAVVTRDHADLEEVELREFVARRLVDFKVPRRIVVLDEIPKGPTGKLQRVGLASKLGLAEQPEPSSAPSAPFTAPRNASEELVAGLWADVLKLERISIHDNFFDIGGDSMLATQFLARAHASTGTELSMSRFFDMPTIASVARWLDSCDEARPKVRSASIHTAGRDGRLPLSFGQRWVWVVHRYQNDAVYNRPAAYLLQGALHIPALEQALTEIVARHEVLRTTISDSDGVPFATIRPPRGFPLDVIDLSDLPDSDRRSHARNLARQEVRRSFDLSKDLMLRAVLFRLEEDEHILTITMHHVASDGWSTGVFLRELGALYRALCQGETPELPELTVQFLDFANWQFERLHGVFLDEQVSYWKPRMAGSPALLQLPSDRPRPAEQAYRGATEALGLSSGLTETLKAFSRQEGVTLFMTLLTAFQTLIHRYTGSEDIVVGSPAGNRTRVETESLIGLFANMLPLRTDLSGNPTVRELLSRVREACVGAYAHQEIPFDKLVEAANPKRSASYSPLFQVMFQLRNYPTLGADLGDLKISDFELGGQVALSDLTLDVIGRSGALRCRLNYNTDLFDRPTAQRMLGHYRTLLESMVREPDQQVSVLPILTKAEQRQLIEEWNDTGSGYPKSACIHEFFERQAEKTPNATALDRSGHALTYDDVQRRSNQWAHHLRKKGVGPETIVAICLERSPDTAVAMLAVLKSGGAFVNIDPTLPKERIEHMLTDAKVRVVICRSESVQRIASSRSEVCHLPFESAEVSNEPESTLSSGVTADNLAYVVYTSGSTGQPKGVAVTHRSVVNYLLSSHRTYGVTAQDRRLQFGAVGTDFFISEVLNYLSAGATLVFPPEQGPPSIAEFVRFLDANRITVTAMPSSYWHEWAAALAESDGWVPPSLRAVITGMEQVQSGSFKIWRERVPNTIRWFNAYGPSETTMTSTVYEARFTATESMTLVPIGRPIANTQVYVLDSRSNLVPVGVPGELYIGGDGVARGYLGQPELTAERFIKNPIPGAPSERVYRTGDLVKYLPDGNLVFLGRADRQVKVRGFRVELDEIENVLNLHPKVRQVAVTLFGDDGNKLLVGYVVPNEREHVEGEEVRTYLRRYLPQHMIPSRFVTLEDMPLTRSGKIDRRALPPPDQQSQSFRSSARQALSPTERELAAVWSEVLGIDRIETLDDFFDLGGDSLKAARLISRIVGVFGVELPLKTIFETPTMAGLAIEIEKKSTGAIETQ